MTGQDDSIRISQTISKQVLGEVVALLSNDIFDNVDSSLSIGWTVGAAHKPHLLMPTVNETFS